VIKVDLPNIITISLAGALGYALIVGATKLYQKMNGQSA
jgi:hypothetical protein